MTVETPGFVCAHHHLYSSLARGMPSPPRTPTTFLEILEQIWWRLDRALDLELVRWSARLGALEALEAGTTGIVDHHSSPDAIEGSLDVIADACAEVGVRVRCCYEVTDRNGLDGAKAGLAENERFLRAGGDGFVGAHACFTLSDDTLDAVSDLAADLGVGVHLHVAESEVDAGAGTRLLAHADQSWLLAHAVHLERPLAGHGGAQPAVEPQQRGRLRRPRPVRPRRPRHRRHRRRHARGVPPRVRARAGRRQVDFEPTRAWQWLTTGAQLVPGVARDRVTWNYEPMEPWHLAYTTGVRPIRVEVDGDVVLDEHGPTRVDAVEIRARAREEAQRLFSRMADV